MLVSDTDIEVIDIPYARLTNLLTHASYPGYDGPGMLRVVMMSVDLVPSTFTQNATRIYYERLTKSHERNTQYRVLRNVRAACLAVDGGQVLVSRLAYDVHGKLLPKESRIWRVRCPANA